MENKNSLTGKHLSGKEVISIPEKPHKEMEKILEIQEAQYHNLRNVTVKFFGIICCCYWSVRIRKIKFD